MPRVRSELGASKSIVVACVIVASAAGCGSDDKAGTAATGESGMGGTGGGAGIGCGHRVENYSYVRPYPDSAPWNVPTCEVAPWSEGEKYADRFWYFSNDRDADPTAADPNRGDHQISFGLKPVHDYTSPMKAAHTNTRH